MTASNLKGGYVSLRTKVVKAAEHGNAHTAAIARPMLGEHLEAMNWIQKTRWAVNKDVLGVARQCIKLGAAFEGFPSANEKPLPPVPDMKPVTPEEKKAYAKAIQARAEVHNANARDWGMRKKLNVLLDTAEEMGQFPAIWFPHYADFRGRFYPRPQDLHTQGDSLVKGLLRFAEGERLGATGAYWMFVALASSQGQDKLPLDERHDWTAKHLKFILDVVADPLGSNMELWSKADSPWETLAWCFEITRYCEWIGLGNDPEEFLNTIPVRLDATCSGIQHLSAMMKDRTSARCVNVEPTGRREDIYSDVARAAIPQNSLDRVGIPHPDTLADDHELKLKATVIHGWADKIERKTVKRAVMTTPYGVKERGILTQLVNDGFCDHFATGKIKYAAAEYLTSVIVGALDENIAAPRIALDYFRSVASHLDDKDLPLIWDTPSGFTVKQAYHKTDEHRVRTLGGDVCIYKENTDAGFKPGKQATGAAPNVVHSFDAAHLAMTCVAMKREGVRDMAFVHDSFGCHAGNVDLLVKHTKEQFVRIYNTDTLEQWRQSVIRHSGVEDIPAVPELGDLDVTCVLKSEFFFS